MKKNKILKQLQSLYDYSQSLDFLPPRGDGAKDAVAMEIHHECIKTHALLCKQLGKDHEGLIESTMLLLELVERMLLDKIGDGYTPEEMAERSDD
jgi:hypothetical protein